MTTLKCVQIRDMTIRADIKLGLDPYDTNEIMWRLADYPHSEARVKFSNPETRKTLTLE